MREKISLGFGVLFGTIANFFASLDLIMKVLILFMVFDYILGLTGAYIEKKMSSKIMFKGGIRKVVVFVVIIIAYYLSRLLQIPIIQDMVIMYYLSMEILSIFEHVVASGVSLPRFLVRFVTALKDSNDDVDITEVK